MQEAQCQGINADGSLTVNGTRPSRSITSSVVQVMLSTSPVKRTGRLKPLPAVVSAKRKAGHDVSEDPHLTAGQPVAEQLTSAKQEPAHLVSAEGSKGQHQFSSPVQTNEQHASGRRGTRIPQTEKGIACLCFSRCLPSARLSYSIHTHSPHLCV